MYSKATSPPIYCNHKCKCVEPLKNYFLESSAFNNSGRIFRPRGYLRGYLYGFQSDFWEDMGYGRINARNEPLRYPPATRAFLRGAPRVAVVWERAQRIDSTSYTCNHYPREFSSHSEHCSHSSAVEQPPSRHVSKATTLK